MTDSEELAKRPLIGLSGFARSGKDTVGQYLVQMYGYDRIGLADAVRSAVYILDPVVWVDHDCTDPDTSARSLKSVVDEIGWDAAKVAYPEVRRLLQVMGTEVGRMMLGDNVWIDIVTKKMIQTTRPVVVTDVRFKNEAEFIRNHGGKVIRVERPGVEALNTHASEALDFDPDYVISNGGSIQELYDEVDSLLSYIM